MNDSSDDLSILARRGALDEGKKRQLALLLHGSLDARLAHRAGCEFDAQDSVLPGDEALAERISERLLRARPIARPVQKAWLKPALGAGAGAAVLLALLVPFALRERPPEPSTPAASMTVPAPVVQGPVSVPIPSTPALSAPMAGPSERAPGAPSNSAGPPSAASSSAKPSAKSLVRSGAAERVDLANSGESARELFARANRARREGEPRRAVTLYELLQKRFPSAPEAEASVLALGMLELSLNQPDAALRHFKAYLARSPQGELGSEALWGKARAHLLLGQKELAKQSFQLLLSQYPESAYAGAARAKLQELL